MGSSERKLPPPFRELREEMIDLLHNKDIMCGKAAAIKKQIVFEWEIYACDLTVQK